MRLISKREFLKKLGLGGVGLAAGAAFGDEVVADDGKLPKGAVGDPNNAWFGRHIFPLEPTVKDGPTSATHRSYHFGHPFGKFSLQTLTPL